MDLDTDAGLTCSRRTRSAAVRPSASAVSRQTKTRDGHPGQAGRGQQGRELVHEAAHHLGRLLVGRRLGGPGRLAPAGTVAGDLLRVVGHIVAGRAVACDLATDRGRRSAEPSADLGVPEPFGQPRRDPSGDPRGSACLPGTDATPLLAFSDSTLQRLD